MTQKRSQVLLRANFWRGIDFWHSQCVLRTPSVRIPGVTKCWRVTPEKWKFTIFGRKEFSKHTGDAKNRFLVKKLARSSAWDLLCVIYRSITADFMKIGSASSIFCRRMAPIWARDGTLEAPISMMRDRNRSDFFKPLLFSLGKIWVLTVWR